MTVAVIERQGLAGGTCVNDRLHADQDPGGQRLRRPPGPPRRRLRRDAGRPDRRSDMHARSRTASRRWCATPASSVEKWLARHARALHAVIHGSCPLRKSADIVRVGDDLLTAPKIFLNVGAPRACPRTCRAYDDITF
ncbi:hypothetical protein ACRAWD_15345 [Caulobacter segnis]